MSELDTRFYTRHLSLFCMELGQHSVWVIRRNDINGQKMTFAILSFKYEVSLEICPLILFADVSGIFREKIYLKRLKIAF